MPFFRWSSATYPAAVKVLSLGGHGFGWDDQILQGIFGRGLTDKLVTCYRRSLFRDVTDARWKATRFRSRADLIDSTKGLLPDEGSLDYLSDQELQELVNALRGCPEVGTPAVWVFDACSMSSIEILAQLDGFPEWVVASFDEEPSQGIPFASALARLDNADVPPSAESVVAAMVAEFARVYRSAPALPGRFGGDYFSLLGLRSDSSTLATVVNAVRDFVQQARPVLQHNSGLVDEIFTKSSSIPRLFRMKYIADLGSLLKCFVALQGDASNIQAVQEVRGFAAATYDAIFNKAKVVAYKYAGSRYKDADGLSVFWPVDKRDFEKHADMHRELNFARATDWTNFCHLFFS